MEKTTNAIVVSLKNCLHEKFYENLYLDQKQSMLPGKRRGDLTERIHQLLKIIKRTCL